MCQASGVFEKNTEGAAAVDIKGKEADRDERDEGNENINKLELSCVKLWSPKQFILLALGVGTSSLLGPLGKEVF